MLDLDALTGAIEGAGFATACVGVALGLAHCRLAPPYALLTALFAAFVVCDFRETAMLVAVELPAALPHGLWVVTHAAGFLLPPIFYFYVRALTGDAADTGPRALLPHAAPAVVATTMTALHVATPPDGETLRLATVAVGIGFYVQCLAYVVAASFAQMHHRARLKDLFASTEAYEMRWILGMALVLCSFALVNLLTIVGLVTGMTGPLPKVVEELFELSIPVVLLLWGFRQSPGLLQAPAPRPDDRVPEKYAKSALDGPRAARISAKLQAAMETEALYRDPNLSLWALAHHVGVSTNYVSQALNEHLGQSFFDYVNGWRIEAAKPLIHEGGRTVEEVAYEVGFNSRSSFYTAFKRRTGQTPKAFAREAGRPRAEPRLAANSA
jgi:AraC-like DNA-binding protein